MSAKALDEELMASSENLYKLACDVGKLEAERDAYKEKLEAIRDAMPLYDENGLCEVEHHCEYNILRERKRVHEILDN